MGPFLPARLNPPPPPAVVLVALNDPVCKIIAACPLCAWGKSTHEPPAGLLNPLPFPRHPWSQYYRRPFITGLPSSSGHSVVFTIVDRFSKSAHFVPLSKLPSAGGMGALLVHHVFPVHGIPCRQGPMWRCFCSTCGLAVSLSSGSHP